MEMEAAVLIHGCHLQADLDGKCWEEIVWGSNNGDPTLEGRAVMGLKVAIEHNAKRIIFSTGASEREGVQEGQYTHRYLLDGVPKLARLFDCGEDELRSRLETNVELDLESQNTREECERNFRLCAKWGIRRVILVSSPWHIQRCLTEALNVAESMRGASEQVPEIMAVASHGRTEGIVILEPPHRGDRLKTTFHILGRRFFKVPQKDLLLFERDLAALLTAYNA